MKMPNNLAARIDAYIDQKVPHETPAYKSIMHSRLLDLCNRNIAISDAAAYLKSGGWSLDFAVYYKELLSEFGKEEKEIKENTMNETGENMTFNAAQVSQLLCALAEDLAVSAGFRAKEAQESGAEYRAKVKQFLSTPRVPSMDTEVLDLIIQQLSSVKEISSAQLAYFQDMKDNQ